MLLEAGSEEGENRHSGFPHDPGECLMSVASFLASHPRDSLQPEVEFQRAAYIEFWRTHGIPDPEGKNSLAAFATIVTVLGSWKRAVELAERLRSVSGVSEKIQSDIA